MHCLCTVYTLSIHRLYTLHAPSIHCRFASRDFSEHKREDRRTIPISHENRRARSVNTVGQIAGTPAQSRILPGDPLSIDDSHTRRQTSLVPRFTVDHSCRRFQVSTSSTGWIALNTVRHARRNTVRVGEARKRAGPCVPVLFPSPTTQSVPRLGRGPASTEKRVRQGAVTSEAVLEAGSLKTVFGDPLGSWPRFHWISQHELV